VRPRWHERQTITLELQGLGAKRCVRLILVERHALLSGRFNVREARGEPERGDARRVRRVGPERALSWRWLGEREARALLDRRLETLRALGYAPSLAPRAAPSEDPSVAALAHRLGLSREAFERPDCEQLLELSVERWVPVLCLLLRSPAESLRRTGEGWLACPAVRYQPPIPTVIHWLEHDVELATALTPWVLAEGPAWLGPKNLEHLATHGALHEVRQAARMWVERLACLGIGR